MICIGSFYTKYIVVIYMTHYTLSIGISYKIPYKDCQYGGNPGVSVFIADLHKFLNFRLYTWFEDQIRSIIYINMSYRPKSLILYHFNQFDSHVSQPSVFCRKSVVVTRHSSQCPINPTCDTAGNGQIWLFNIEFWCILHLLVYFWLSQLPATPNYH